MGKRLSDVCLVLFFTRGVSLRTWDTVGILEREVAVYRLLQQHGLRVAFVTYGGPGDLSYADKIPSIQILCNRWQLPAYLYGRFLPILHGFFLFRAGIYKTNQTDGAEAALRAARLWHKPLIARCGYMWSEFVARSQGEDSEMTRHARKVENAVFQAAQRVVVTTRSMHQEVTQRTPSATKRTVIIPNYVDTNHFHPVTEDRDEGEIVFVGRLSPQKNAGALLEAIQPLGVRLTIIGDGELRIELQRRFGTLNGRLRWQGNVPNSELPVHLNRASLFILPSHYEGHPKALMEAMACGLPVIGADSPGIREIIRHGETGWLCGTDPKSIRKAIQELLALPEMRAELGRQARHFIKEQFSLERVVDMELALLREITVS